jgi:hypothetical protein
MASGNNQSLSIASPLLSVCSRLLEIELLEEVAGGRCKRSRPFACVRRDVRGCRCKDGWKGPD